jgi:hypothetical protein
MMRRYTHLVTDTDTDTTPKRLLDKLSLRRVGLFYGHTQSLCTGVHEVDTRGQPSR